MKYLKYYEYTIEDEPQNFREVDLQLLWDDLNYYQFKLFDKPKHIDNFYLHQILIPLLLNKNVEFLRSIHHYDKEISYGMNGKIENINISDGLEQFDKFKSILANLENDPNTWILAKIDGSGIKFDPSKNIIRKDKKPAIIKIYNSEPLEIEDKILSLKSSEKYNL